MVPPTDSGPDLSGNRPLVRDYSLVALAALLILGFLLYTQPAGYWGLLPVLVGVVGVGLRWSGAPAYVLLSLLIVLILRNRMFSPWGYGPSDFPLTDLVLAMVVLTYTAAHMRLVTLTRNSIPPDPRRMRGRVSQRVAGRWLLPRTPARRGAWGGNPGELFLFLVSMPLFALVAWVLWARLTWESDLFPPGMQPEIGQVLVVVWGVGAVVLVVGGFLSYLARAQATSQESLLYLQDQLWSATRGEQRRINRWLVWARLRAQKKKEQR
jgi:hypothetical protein